MKKVEKITLFQHQKDAITQWMKNSKQGIFEMATGTGKTFTALGCVQEIQKECDCLVVVIACPQLHLIHQWNGDLVKFGTKYDNLIIVDSSNRNWKNKIVNVLIDVRLKYEKYLIVLTTHRSASSSAFIDLINNAAQDTPLLLIADEVHDIGSPKYKQGLSERYNFRLGLSATPIRWFDEIGTKFILDYFKGVVFEYSLKDAINSINPATGETYLTPFRYIPRFITLSQNELEDYIEKTKKIATLYLSAKDSYEKERQFEFLIFKRAEIIKNAMEKYNVLEKLLDEISPLQWTIIYCSPQQIDSVVKIINAKKKSINVHRFTMQEDPKSNPKYNGLSERDYILQKFASKDYHILVAMKCLDEGVDIPPAKNAILMASSGNPREYIQRIGRVIRRYWGKTEAVIYDIIVVPSFIPGSKELMRIERKIFEKELKRYEEIAKIAVNNSEALKLIYDLKIKYD